MMYGYDEAGVGRRIVRQDVRRRPVARPSVWLLPALDRLLYRAGANTEREVLEGEPHEREPGAAS